MRLSFSISIAVVLLQCPFTKAGVVERDGNVTLPAPIIATPSQHWEGNDGTWSTFEIRVGTPGQVARVLPATSWQETWVVWKTVNGCNTSLGVAADCFEARGGAFDSHASSTWHDEGQFTLGLNNLLGYDGVADYGFDTVGLGYTNDSGPTLSHQIVAEIQSNSYWFGILGLGFQPTNFSDYGNPQASFSDSLFTNGTIASKSWSYTAGAYYRLKGIFGSLIWGGYDASRFTPNDVVFTMTGDNLRDIVLYVRSIVSTTSKGNTTLMSSSEKVFIDSTVVDYWLPVSVCQEFEKAFGLQVDKTTGRYLISSATHDKLVADNPNITFTLGDQATGGHTVDIVLPYTSFDLNISAPFVNATSRYFPLRQGQNDSMYTLGRAFLQETYVTVNYHTRTFNVSQAIFDQNSKAQIIAIPSDAPVPTSGGNGTANGGGGGGTSSPGGSKGLSGGAIAGIVVGSVILLLLIGGIFFCCTRGIWCFSSRRRPSSPSEKPPTTPTFEIDSGKRIDPNTSAYTAQASGLASEVPGQDAKVEIAGNPIMHPQELEAEVPGAMLARYHNQAHDMSGRDSGEDTGVSSVSQSPEGVTRPSELHSAGRRPTNGRENEPHHSAEEELVSPVQTYSPGHRHRGGAGGVPDITVSSPADSHATWSPKTPVQGTY